MMELESHDSAYFVTLTYAPGKEPISVAGFDENGEAITNKWYTLNSRDLQLFLKRLRKHYSDDKIRFFACGEYGDQTYRPHYHAILFGLHLDDLEFYKSSRLGFSYWNSPKLESIWGYGYVVVTQVTWETCAYVARYVMKKKNGKDSKFYEEMNIEPEFVRMSRKPGLAHDYFDRHPGIYDYNYINIATENGGVQFSPPRYFDKLFEEEHGEVLEAIKKRRKETATVVQESKLARTSLDQDELLAVEERSFDKKISALRRSLE